MKVITKSIIDMRTCQVVHEESYEYSGPVAICGGSSGGGGSSGEVSWPTYLETIHEAWLGSGAPSSTMTAVISAAQGVGGNPYSVMKSGGLLADPTNIMISLNAIYTKYKDDVYDNLGEPVNNWKSMMDQADAQVVRAFNQYLDLLGGLWLDLPRVAADKILSSWAFDSVGLMPAWIQDRWHDMLGMSAKDVIGDIWRDPTPTAATDIADNLGVSGEITDDVMTYSATVSDLLNADILPRFRAGMRDINAVHSSSFIIGQAILEGMSARDVAKYMTELRLKAFLQRDEYKGKAYLQYDQIYANNDEKFSLARTQAVIQEDQLNATNVMKKNESLSMSAIEDYRVFVENYMRKMDAISRAHLLEDQLTGEHQKAYALINAELVRHGVSSTLNGSDQALRNVGLSADHMKTVAQTGIEAHRIGYVMYKEWADKNFEVEVGEKKWKLETFQYGANLLAAISGGTAFPSNSLMPVQSAVGGAFAGAAIGAQVSPTPMGAGVGALIGGIGGLLMS